MNKLKQFFKISKYEMLRVARNKVVFAMLIFFSIAFLLISTFIQTKMDKYPIAVFTDGLSAEQDVVTLIEDNLKEGKIIYVNSAEEGKDLVKKNKVCFFICLNAGEEKDNVTAVFYYDQSNIVGKTVADKLQDAKNQYAYNTITEFLAKYGITLNESYFQTITFQTITERHIGIKQSIFVLEIAVCVSLVLMLGLAYSVARDNETQVSKNLAYLPIGVNKYMLAKILPYFCLGMLELAICLFLGVRLVNIQYQVNIFIILALMSLPVLAILMLGFVFCQLKSQISTIFFDMLAIILPIFITWAIYVQACPIYIQVLLNCFPLVPIIYFLQGMVFNGVYLWHYVPIFITQIVVFYLIAYIILKKRVRK